MHVQVKNLKYAIFTIFHLLFHSCRHRSNPLSPKKNQKRNNKSHQFYFFSVIFFYAHNNLHLERNLTHLRKCFHMKNKSNTGIDLRNIHVICHSFFFFLKTHNIRHSDKCIFSLSLDGD